MTTAPSPRIGIHLHLRRRLRALAAPFVGVFVALLLSSPVRADVRATAPVAPGSPAWNALLDLPVVDRDGLAFAVPVQLAEWGRPQESEALRRDLLLLQLRVAAGTASLPAPTAKLRDVTPITLPGAGADALQDAWAQALDRAFALVPGAPGDVPQVGREPPVALAGIPGFWRVDDAGHVVVRATVTNRANVRLASLDAGARVGWNGRGVLDLRCGLLVRPPGLAPGASAPLHCVGDRVPQGVSGWPRDWHWVPTPLVADAQVLALTAALGGSFSGGVASVAGRFAGCEAQGNCSDAQREANHRDEVLAARAAQDRIAQVQAERHQADLEQLRARRRGGWMLLGALVLGQGVFIVLARLTGSIVPGVALVLAGTGFLSWNLHAGAQQMSRDSMAPLVFELMAFGVFGLAAVLCVAYAAVYRAFFRPR